MKRVQGFAILVSVCILTVVRPPVASHSLPQKLLLVPVILNVSSYECSTASRNPATCRSRSKQFLRQIYEYARQCFAALPKIPTTPERSKLMSRVRQSGTALEIKVQSIFESLDVNYQMNVNELPGRPDLVNTADKWAVFVHGCFWHAHENCRLWKIPKTNSEFWKAKFTNNKERDIRKYKELSQIGYKVLVIWECELAEERKLISRIRQFLSV